MVLNNKRKEALRDKAKSGDVQAQYDVYQMDKTDSDRSGEARQFLEESAKKGHVAAQLALGSNFISELSLRVKEVSDVFLLKICGQLVHSSISQTHPFCFGGIYGHRICNRDLVNVFLLPWS